MKKYFLYTLIVLHIVLIKNVSAQTDFLVKKSSSGDETYSNEVKEVSLWSPLSFQITSVWWSAQKEFQITFPAWFVYNSHSTDGNCNTQVTVQNNSFFKYHFSGLNNCVSEVTFSYTPNQSGNYVISIFEGNTLTQNVRLWISAQNSIIKALSLDQNNNGFLDGYEIYFSYPITDTWDYHNVKIGGVWATWYVGNSLSWIITFADNTFHTGQLPQILSSLGVFWNVGVLNNFSVIEEDNAAPLLVKINGSTLTNTGYIGNGNIVFDFSERLNPDKKDFVIKNGSNTIWWTYTLNEAILTFTPNSTFNVGNYQFIIGNTVEDFSHNTIKNLSAKTLIMTGNVIWNCLWLPANASWNSVSQINRYWDGISWIPSSLMGVYNETSSVNECRFVCNSGFLYDAENNLCSDSQTPSWWSLGTGTWILINNGSQNTQTRYINLALLASDNVWVSEMMISNESNFSLGVWESYSTNKAWTLSENSGNKTIYVKFRDALWNESPVYNDSIVYTPLESYITFGTWVNIYSNSLSVSLFWTCRLIDNYGVESPMNIIKYSVNNIVSGSFNCTNYSWSGTAQIEKNTTNTIKIWFENNALISNTFHVIHPTPLCNTPTNGVALWVYPNCDFRCNSWYIKSGNNCIVQDSWWSGWWGWYSGWGGGGSIWDFYVCNVAQLQCISQNGSYIWQKKPWVMCSWWFLWQKCSAENILPWTSNNTQNNWWSIFNGSDSDIKGITDYLLSQMNTSLHKTINDFSNMIDYPHSDFIHSDAKIQEHYFIVLKNYRALFENINSYLTSKEKTFLSEAKKNYTTFYSSHKILLWWEESYITKVKKWNDIIYETKIISLQPTLKKIENIIIQRYKTKLSSGKISLSQYKEHISHYNSFILYLSIFKKEKSSSAQEFGKKALQQVIKDYSL